MLRRLFDRMLPWKFGRRRETASNGASAAYAIPAWPSVSEASP